MAMTYACVRCGNLFNRIEVSTDSYMLWGTPCDLCPKCLQYLDNWLNEFKEK